MPVYSLCQLLHGEIVFMCVLLKKDYKKVSVLLPVIVAIRSLLRVYKIHFSCIKS